MKTQKWVTKPEELEVIEYKGMHTIEYIQSFGSRNSWYFDGEKLYIDEYLKENNRTTNRMVNIGDYLILQMFESGRKYWRVITKEQLESIAERKE